MAMLLQKNRLSEEFKDHLQLNGFKSNGCLKSRQPIVHLKKELCCVPGRSCQNYSETILSSDPKDVIRVVCSNDGCCESGWIHAECFDSWEDHLVTYLKTCGRARNWSDKQRMQNLWTKKAYDLVRPVCNCRCGSGFLRKDLTYIPPADQSRDDERKQKRSRRRSEPAHPNKPHFYAQLLSSVHSNSRDANGVDFEPIRSRTISFVSGGSGGGSFNGSDSSPSSPELDDMGTVLFPKQNFFLSREQAATGNIFKHRSDFGIFQDLPASARNPYHIKLEDEGQYGNDETRSFIMTTLSQRNVTCVNCVICGTVMPIFDKYPLVDGTFFLSPLRYNTDLKVRFHGNRSLYMNAICFHCMVGTKNVLRCKSCTKSWNGSMLIIGTMYTYDIFAAMPCCKPRLACNGCHRPIVDSNLNFFSDFSRSVVCPLCQKDDYHFVKPIQESYYILR